MSTNVIGPSGVCTTVSIESRVVPGMSCTTERSWPTSRLKRVLLPTLGRPTIDTRGMPGVRLASLRSGLMTSWSSPSRRGRRANISSSTSPALRPCSAETGYGSPRPKERNSHLSNSRLSVSTLFETTRTSLPLVRNHLAIA